MVSSRLNAADGRRPRRRSIRMREEKRIALIANDNRKDELRDWVYNIPTGFGG